jgi:hypothetical protein
MAIEEPPGRPGILARLTPGRQALVDLDEKALDILKLTPYKYVLEFVTVG